LRTEPDRHSINIASTTSRVRGNGNHGNFIGAAISRDPLPEGQIALGKKFQNPRIGLTRFFDFDIPRLMKALRRKPASIAKGRWAAYAAAGAASAFTCANSAEGTIHYSGRINQVFDQCYLDTATFQLDQPGDFIRLRHNMVFCSTDYGGGAYFAVGGLAGASFAGRYNTCTTFREPALVSRLRFGQFISNRPFIPGASGILAIASHDRCGDGWVGQFDGKGVGFIGFKFNNGSGDQYGWVRIQMQRGDNINQNFQLKDYAYGDVGDRIRAGQMSSNEMLPDEGSLGWLALGAAGLLAWRKSRSPKL
jgi:hypothetical protein